MEIDFMGGRSLQLPPGKGIPLLMKFFVANCYTFEAEILIVRLTVG